ncbi:hypothetical protein DPMN_046556 [Dreissena polymorpha]|uniref:C1q domain-containing protein n=2 Tax=Dreissena polymorpha TaxID=45954 RepID=A0A9D4D8M4_DREPO|nr:hypothetical protein DPMN_046556 [Dreissena polymorpha]
MHNGNVIAIAHSHPGIFEQGAITAVIKVAAGDEIWISNLDHGPESAEGGSYSSFCGVLLYQL